MEIISMPIWRVVLRENLPSHFFSIFFKSHDNSSKTMKLQSSSCPHQCMCGIPIPPCIVCRILPSCRMLSLCAPVFFFVSSPFRKTKLLFWVCTAEQSKCSWSPGIFRSKRNLPTNRTSTDFIDRKYYYDQIILLHIYIDDGEQIYCYGVMKKVTKASVSQMLGKKIASNRPADQQIVSGHEQQVPVRLFPHAKVPRNVAIHRRMKQYASVDLNQALHAIDWQMGSTFCLIHFIYLPAYVFEYGCTHDNIKKGKVRGRAWNGTAFQPFTVTAVKDDEYFEGYFWSAVDRSWLHRNLVCLNFEDPQVYIREVRMGVERRQRILGHIKYQFYVDNVDLEGAPQPHPRLLMRVNQLVGKQEFDSLEFANVEKEAIMKQYKRSMNQLLVRKHIVEEELPIYLPGRTKHVGSVVVRRQLGMVKDNRVVKMVGKGVRQREEDFIATTIYVREVTELLLQLKSRLSRWAEADLFNHPCSPLDQFIADTHQSFSSAYSTLLSCVICPLGDCIREVLKQQPQPWLRPYQRNRQYENSKLKRAFILISNIIRDEVKEKLLHSIHAYIQQLQKHVGGIVISAKLHNNQLRLEGKVKERLQKMLLTCVGVFASLPSLEFWVMGEVGGAESIGLNIPPSINHGKQEHRWILGCMGEWGKVVGQCTQALESYECEVDTLNQKLCLDQLLQTRAGGQISSLTQQLGKVVALSQSLHNLLPSYPVQVGIFAIDFSGGKEKIQQHLQLTIRNLKYEILHATTNHINQFHHHTLSLFKQVNKRPSTLSELVGKQSLFRHIHSTIQSYGYKQMSAHYEICMELGCRLPAQDVRRRWESQQIIKDVYKAKSMLSKEFEEIRKKQRMGLKREIVEIKQSLGMARVTKCSMEANVNLSKYLEYEEKVYHIGKELDRLKGMIKNMKEVIRILSIPKQELYDEAQIFSFEEEFTPFKLFWPSYAQWIHWYNIWTYDTIGSFQLHEPQKIMHLIRSNISKAIIQFHQIGNSYYTSMGEKVSQHIDDFLPKLQLLKLLKKEGLTIRHFEEIGLPLSTPIDQMTLSKCIAQNFLSHISQISSVSTEAWNYYSMQQTIKRVDKQLWLLKFQFSFYLDKKNNQIPMILNYEKLLSQIDNILNNLQSLQYNPMKKRFDEQIKDMYGKSSYLSKSVSLCQKFQSIFISIHPIFDSTDIIKQIPTETKNFSKVMRNWLQILSYLKKISSVHESCYSQNLFEKTKNLLRIIETIRRDLSQLLQNKRKEFGRFYLLSHSEMFELFSSTNSMEKINQLIPKLFDGIGELQTQNGFITQTKSGPSALVLSKPILYRGFNFQNWIACLQKQIKISLLEEMKALIGVRSEKMMGNIDKYCKKYTPQTILLWYEMNCSEMLGPQKKQLQRFIKEQRNILQVLVTKKNRLRDKGLSEILQSLIITVIGKIDQGQKLRKMGIQSMDEFQWKKLVKITLINATNEPMVKVQILNLKKDYGFEFLGSYSRLVYTSLTERTQLVYMLAYQYSLACAAMGAAGTGKTETTKQIARIHGESCLVYNCSEEMQISTLNRLLKGVGIVGLWICFEEMNRLKATVLSVLSEQLSLLLKFRRFGHRMEFDFYQDIINVNPKFHVCATYNPTYIARSHIPAQMKAVFRSITMIHIDQMIICKSLLYSSGFLFADSLANKLSSCFEYCQQKWQHHSQYDFGLRALRAVIQLGASKLVESDPNEEDAILSSLLILTTPKMEEDDCEAFRMVITRFFPTFISHSANSDKVSNLNQILHIRDSIILYGQPLSGKNFLLHSHRALFPEWELLSVYQDILSNEEIYGKLEPTTKLWTDGFFTEAIRKRQNVKTKTISVFNGSIHSEWVENMNSVLDSTRKLSLASGQVLTIPKSFKILMLSRDLGTATPATITRSSIMFCKPLNINELSTFLNKNFTSKFIQFHEQLQQKIKRHFKLHINPKIIFFWVLNYYHFDEAPSYESLIYFLSIIYTGILTNQGLSQFQEFCKSYLSLPLSPFQIILRKDNQIESREKGFKEWLKQKSHSQQQTVFSEIFVPSEQTFAIELLTERFIESQKRKVLLLIGEYNIGKTTMMKNFYSKLSKQRYNVKTLYLTKKTTSKQLYHDIHGSLIRKTSNKFGQSSGMKLNLWIEDFNLPNLNKFSIQQTTELFRLLINEQQIYNYQRIEREYVDDIIFMGDAKLRNQRLNLNSRFYRFLQPIFLPNLKVDQIKTFFCSLVKQSYNNQNIKQILTVIEKGVEFYGLLQPKRQSKSLFVTFMDLYRAVQGFMRWNCLVITSKLEKLFVFQLSRTIITKAENQQNLIDLQQKLFTLFPQCNFVIPLFSCLEKNNSQTLVPDQVFDFEGITNYFQSICNQYHKMNQTNSFVIVFPDMIKLLIKIDRTLSFDGSHLILIGNSKCGKKTILNLCIFLRNCQLFQFEQRSLNWNEFLKNSTRECFKAKNSSVLMVQHQHLKKFERQEDLNRLINSMQNPSLYNEADVEELVYLFRTDLIMKKLPVTIQSMWNELIPFLKKNLHIVLLLNPNFEQFTQDLSSFPSFMKHCTCFWFQKWPEQAMILVASSQLINQNAQLDFLPKIHELVRKRSDNQKSRNKNIWQGMYFQFIFMIKRISEISQKQLEFQRAKYIKSLQIIKKTEAQLFETRNQIRKLQPTIIFLENETAKAIKSLNLQKKSLNEISDKLVLKNQEVQKVIFSSNKIKTELEEKLDKIHEQMKKAWEVVSLLQTKHVSQVKVMSHPSEFIQIVLTALVILIHDGSILTEWRNGIQQENYFQTAKKYILSKDAKTLSRILTSFKPQEVSKQTYQKLQQMCFSYKRWTQSQARRANKAIYYFFIWVEAVALNYRIFHQTNPMRKQFHRITEVLNQKQNEAKKIQQELMFYEKKIYSLESQYQEKKKTLDEYRLKNDKFQKMLNQGYELLKQISSEKGKWGNYIQKIDQKLCFNFGDAILMSSTIIYLSQYDYQTRSEMKNEIKDILNEKCILYSEQKLVWNFTYEKKQLYQNLNIRGNEFLIDNFQILQKSTKINFLIDPEQQGMRYIKEKNWRKDQIKIIKLSQDTQNLEKQIQLAIISGHIIFLEINPSKINEKIQYILAMKVSENNVFLGEKKLYMHHSFHLYLYTRTFLQVYPVELLTNVQTINFKMTSQQLKQKILDLLIAHQIPTLKTQLEQITKLNIQDQINLEEIQDKLLSIFSEDLSSEEILQNQDIFNTVFTSNRLYQQITTRIQASKQKTQQITQQLEQFTDRVVYITKVYKSVRLLQTLNPFYSFSYEWFIYILENNIENFMEVIYQELCKTLKNNQKQIASIIIIQALCPQFPWNSLFNSLETETFLVEQQKNKSQGHDGNEKAMKKLPISQQKWSRIIKKVKKVSQYVNFLGEDLKNNPEIFLPLIDVSKEKILEYIPQKYSNQSFFNRIMLVSCFRQDCVLYLLDDWISINISPKFISKNNSIDSFFLNTRPYRPILVVCENPAINIEKKIKEIYRHCFKVQDENISLNTLTWSKEIQNEFDEYIKASVMAENWAVVYGVKKKIQMGFLKDYFDEFVVLPNNFRIWIVIEDDTENSQIFYQFCDKVHLTQEQNLVRDIRQSFFEVFDKKNESDYYERNKKKLLISQICIFHHLLKKINSLVKEIFPEKDVKVLTIWDIKITLEQIHGFVIDENCKKILRQVMMHLSYGSQITRKQDLDYLERNINEILNGINIERNIFWGTVWSEDTFPKDFTEYEYQVRKIIQEKKYLDKFNIDERLQYQLDNDIFEKVCSFFAMRTFKQRINKAEKFLANLKQIKAEIQKVDFQQFERVKVKINQLQKLNKGKFFYHYLIKQLQGYKNLIVKIKKDIMQYINKPKRQLDKLENKFMFTIFSDQTPLQWGVGKKTQKPQRYCFHLVENFSKLLCFVENLQQKHISVSGKMIIHPQRFLQAVSEFWGKTLTPRSIFIFSSEQQNLQKDSQMLIISELLLWNIQYQLSRGLYYKKEKILSNNYVEVSGRLSYFTDQKRPENYKMIPLFSGSTEESENDEPIAQVLIKSHESRQNTVFSHPKNIYISFKP